MNLTPKTIVYIIFQIAKFCEERSILIIFLTASWNRVQVRQEIIWRKGPRRSDLSFKLGDDVDCVKVMSGLEGQSTRVVPRDLSVSYFI